MNQQLIVSREGPLAAQLSLRSNRNMRVLTKFLKYLGEDMHNLYEIITTRINESILDLRVILERKLDKNQSVIIKFIDIMVNQEFLIYCKKIVGNDWENKILIWKFNKHICTGIDINWYKIETVVIVFSHNREKTELFLTLK